MKKFRELKFIDLFAGLGGTRLGFQDACDEMGIQHECVFTSEIKDHAIKAYVDNFPSSKIDGDITHIKPSSIPNFDFLLAGFPCQPFSSAGKRLGFLDERGGLFFVILKILEKKRPQGFLLENVEGLVNHDNGETLNKILTELKKLDYHVSWRVLDASDFGVPQKRKRIYIAGNKDFTPDLEGFEVHKRYPLEFINEEAEIKHTPFTKLLSKKFKPDELYGKSIKDKRGGGNNIHSWNLSLKGKVSNRQEDLLGIILKRRRSKQWAELKGIEWMDGMPLTLSEIRTFVDYPELENDLEYLTDVGYLKFEHPKEKVMINGVSKRVFKVDSPKGFNIVSGKLSFEITHIVNPKGVCPTIVATEAGKIAVATKNGVRPITVEEGLAFSGYPGWYRLKNIEYKKAFDLIGNTVMPPVIKSVSVRLLGGK